MHDELHAQAFEEGRRTGLAIAAVAAAAVAFVSLLGLEKAVLAVVLAALARKGTLPGSRARQLASLALIIALLYVLTFAAVMVLFHEKVGELIRMLQRIS